MAKYCQNTPGPVLLHGEEANTIPSAYASQREHNQERPKKEMNVQIPKAGAEGRNQNSVNRIAGREEKPGAGRWGKMK